MNAIAAHRHELERLLKDLSGDIASAGTTFGVLNRTVERSVGLGTNRQIQFALKLNF